MRVWSVDRSRHAAPAIRAVLRSEDGVALVLALITLVVMVLITVALVTGAVTETLSSQVHEDSGRALNVAEAGAAHAIGHALRIDRNWADSADATAGDCPGSVTIQGVEWRVLRDRTRGCLQNIPYPDPKTAAIGVTPVPGGGGGAVACGSSVVNVGTGTVTGTPPTVHTEIGRYTVLFRDTNRTDGTLVLRVTGTVGRATRGIEFVAERVTPAAFVAYSASAVNARHSGAGTFDINGSIYVRGNWEYKGNSAQTNRRPVSTRDAASPPFENQTFVCNNLIMQGNAQIGEPARPMMGVHVGGSVIRRGGSADIYTSRMTRAVPDIGLGDVARLTMCIRGTLTLAQCNDEFGPEIGPRIWNSYTNNLDGGRTRWIRHEGGTWRDAVEAPSPLVFGGQAFALPKRNWPGQPDQEVLCRERVAANLPLRDILAVCSLYYDAANRVIYVAGGQVIYLHGRMRLDVAIRYRVDNDPLADTQTQTDTSVVVVACEEGCTARDRPSLHLDRRFVAGLTDSERGSRNLHFARSDLLAFTVSGSVQLPRGARGRGCDVSHADEVNAAFVVGGTPGKLFAGQGQMFGAAVAAELVLDEPPANFNFSWCQVPDLRDLLGATLLGPFLNDPAHTTVIMQNWREVGF